MNKCLLSFLLFFVFLTTGFSQGWNFGKWIRPSSGGSDAIAISYDSNGTISVISSTATNLTFSGFTLTSNTSSSIFFNNNGIIGVIIDGNPILVTNYFDLDNRIGLGQIQDSSIQAINLDDDSVTTSKILDGNVTASKIANGSITAKKLNLSVSDDIELTSLPSIDPYITVKGILNKEIDTNRVNGQTLVYNAASNKYIHSVIGGGDMSSDIFCPNAIAEGFTNIVDSTLGIYSLSGTRYTIAASPSPQNGYTLKRSGASLQFTATPGLGDMTQTQWAVNQTTITNADGSPKYINYVDNSINSIKINNIWFPSGADDYVGYTLSYNTESGSNYLEWVNPGLSLGGDMYLVDWVADGKILTDKLPIITGSMLANGSITSNKIANDSVYANNIADGEVFELANTELAGDVTGKYNATVVEKLNSVELEWPPVLATVNNYALTYNHAENKLQLKPVGVITGATEFSQLNDVEVPDTASAQPTNQVLVNNGSLWVSTNSLNLSNIVANSITISTSTASALSGINYAFLTNYIPPLGTAKTNSDLTIYGIRSNRWVAIEPTLTNKFRTANGDIYTIMNDPSATKTILVITNFAAKQAGYVEAISGGGNINSLTTSVTDTYNVLRPDGTNSVVWTPWPVTMFVSDAGLSDYSSLLLRGKNGTYTLISDTNSDATLEITTGYNLTGVTTNNIYLLPPSNYISALNTLRGDISIEVDNTLTITTNAGTLTLGANPAAISVESYTPYGNMYNISHANTTSYFTLASTDGKAVKIFMTNSYNHFDIDESTYETNGYNSQWVSVWYTGGFITNVDHTYINDSTWDLITWSSNAWNDLLFTRFLTNKWNVIKRF